MYRRCGIVLNYITLKADSHIACRAHAVPLSCRAAKGLECVFPIWFTQCGRVWFTLAMPCPCHPRPCQSSQGHGTAWPSRKSLWTNCPRSASSGYYAEFHEVVIRRIPISVAGGQCETKHRLSWMRKRVVAAHYEKDDMLHCWNFRQPCGHSRRTRHCRSMAGARHAMCESALKGSYSYGWRYMRQAFLL